MALSLREAAFNVARAECDRHVVEVGGNNRGAAVKKYLTEVGLPEGYSWCDAFVSWAYSKAAGKRLAWESAGVAVTYSYAKAHGWLVTRPKRYDLYLPDFNADGQFNDHIGFVAWVKKFGPVSIIHTIEGNTSSGEAGSQADGGGVYRRTRIVRSKTAAYIRVPGNAKS